jgi:anti-sigma-K factor RskA
VSEQVRHECDLIDELAAAYALGAVEPAEEHVVTGHLATCERPHHEARSLGDAASALPASLDPVVPSAELRRRLMTTVADTPQERERTPRLVIDGTPAQSARSPWWRLSPLPSALAAAALAAAVGLGAWGYGQSEQLADREAALNVIASADAVYAAAGDAGAGWVVESDGKALFIAEGLAELRADRIYELWLIGPDGTPLAVGTLTDADGLVLTTLERSLDDATTFAITVEAERVEAPTSDPVLLANLAG